MRVAVARGALVHVQDAVGVGAAQSVDLAIFNDGVVPLVVLKIIRVVPQLHGLEEVRAQSTPSGAYSRRTAC